MRSHHARRWIPLLVVPLLLASGSAVAGDAEKSDGVDVLFRDADIAALSEQARAVYGEAEPGDGKKLEPAFPGAPPQIAHTLVDMLPILADDNECLNCHHPENVESKKDAPLPESHFRRPVMGKGGKSGMVWVVKGYEDDPDEFSRRYDCMMCHAPQTTNVKDPETTFVRVEEKK